MSDIKALKDLLIDTIASQIENGITVTTKQGEVVTVDAPAPVLAVAAKVIKDWSHEIDAGTQTGAQIEKLSNYLSKRRPDLKVAN